MAAAYLAVIALIDPRRAFPVDDSWCFAWSVKRLLADGRLRIHDLASPSLVGHVWWGALFCLPGGFSYTALRVSTLTLGFAVLGLAFLVLRRLSVPRGTAAWATLLLMASPLFLPLCFTYMTDVPFLAWCLLAAYCGLRAAQGGDERWLMAASAAGAAAFLVRQVGLLVPVGLAAALWRSGRLDRRRAAALGALPAAVWLGYLWWARHVRGPTWADVNYNHLATAANLLAPARLGIGLLLRTGASLLTLGLCLFPFTAALAAGEPAALLGDRRWLLPASVAFLFFLRIFGGLPYSVAGSGILNRYGLGTVTLAAPGAKAAGVFAWTWAWRAATAAALAGVLALTPLLRRAVEAASLDLWTAALPLALPAAPFLVAPRFYDRYLLGPLAAAVLIASVVAARRRWSRAALAAGCAAMLAWSAAGTADCLDWHQSAMAAGRAAVAAGVPASEVSDGYEWAGLHSVDPALAALKQREPLDKIPDGAWDRWGTRNALVSFSATPPGADWRSGGTFPYATPLARSGGRLTLFLSRGAAASR